ncbi:MAG TPA: cyclic nucleotide-binding domain-containing protein [Spirochaetota bacterium]
MTSRILKFTANERIIRAGENDNRMYIILSGSVQISLHEGADSIQVSVLNKGDFFGEMSLLINRARTADAIAMGDVTVTYIESLDQLRDFLQSNTNFAIKMLKIMAERLTKTDKLLIGVVTELHRLKIEYES